MSSATSDDLSTMRGSALEYYEDDSGSSSEDGCCDDDDCLGAEDVARVRAMSHIASTPKKWQRAAAMTVKPKRAFGKVVKARSQFADEPKIQKKASMLSIAEICFGHEHQDKDHQGSVMEKLGGGEFFGAFNKSLVQAADRQHKLGLFQRDVEAVAGKPSRLDERLRTLTLSTAGIEEMAREPQHTVDDSYISVTHSIVAQGGINDTEALELVRQLYGVDAETHAACIRQRAAIPNVLTVGTALLLDNVGLVGVPTGSDPDSEVVCIVQALPLVTTAGRETRDLDRRLYKAVVKAAKKSAKAEPGAVMLVRQLLEAGADPNVAASKDGRTTSMDAALEDTTPSTALRTLLHQFGGLAGTTGAAAQGLQVKKSSGIFETVPTTFNEAVKGFPDQFVIPLEDGGASALLSVEVWSIAKNAASARESVASNDPPGGRTKPRRKKHSFFNGRDGGAGIDGGSQAVEIDRGGNKLVLVGSAKIDLATLPVESTISRVLPLSRAAGAAPTDHFTSVKLSMKITTDFRETKACWRQYHRGLLHRVHHNLLRRTPKSVPFKYPDMMGSPAAAGHRALLELHSNWIALSPMDAATDRFCSLMELHTDSKLGSEGRWMSHGHPPGLCPSDMDAAVRACLAQCRPEGPGTALRGETADIARIAAAMESAVGSCIEYASKPQRYFANAASADAKGVWPSPELGSAVNVLRQVFTVDEWQHFTAKSVDTYTNTNGISLPGVDPLELSSSTLIKDAIDMIKAEPNPTYMHVKKGLLRRYGREEFEQSKHAIHRLLQMELVGLEDTVVDLSVVGEATIMQRFERIIAETDSGELTYSRIKSVLTKEFGDTNFENHHRTISTRLITHKNKELTFSGPGFDGAAKKRVLVDELNHQLEGYIMEVYRALKTTTTPTDIKDPIQKGLVSMVRMGAALQTELRGLYTSYHAQYARIPEYSFFANISAWADKLVAADLQEQLGLWKPQVASDDFPIIFFNLLTSTRDLWDMIAEVLAEIGVTSSEGYRISKYDVWFFPFAQDFLKQCKPTACTMIDRSLALETWEPQTTMRVSGSARELLVIIHALTDKFNRIDWPDEEARVQVLFFLLCDAVCTATERYCERVADLTALDAVSGTFFLGDDPSTLLRLNSLEHIATTLVNIKDYMDLDQASKAHRIAAKEALALSGASPSRRSKELRGAKRLRRTEETIQRMIQAMSHKIASLVGIRLHNDLGFGFDALCSAINGKPADPGLVVAEAANTTLDGLLMDGPDVDIGRIASAENKADFDAETTSLWKRRRRKSSAHNAELKQDGYLTVNLAVLVTATEKRATMEKVAYFIWIEFCRVLKAVLVTTMGSLQESWTDAERTYLLDFTTQLKYIMTSYLNDEDQGLPGVWLSTSWDLVAKPIMQLCLESSPELERFFYQQAAIAQSGPLVPTRIGSNGSVRSGRSRRSERSRQSYRSGRSRLGVSQAATPGDSRQTGITVSKVMSIIRIAPSTEPHLHGSLRVVFARRSATAEGVVTVTVLKARDLPASEKNFYFTAKQVPEVKGGLSFKSPTAKAQPIWDECSFTVAPDADESAIEIRVYAKRGPLGQSAALLGELLLGFQQVLATPNDYSAVFPLQTGFPEDGLLSQVAQLIQPRPDKVAKAFSKRVGKLAAIHATSHSSLC